MVPYVRDYCKCCTYGPNGWQEHHHKAKDALRGSSKAKENLRRSGIDGKMTIPTGSLRLPVSGSDAWVRYLDHVVQIDISIKRRMNKGRDTRTYFIYGVLTKINRHHFYRRNQVRHHPLLQRHQAQHGGVRLHGLRAGRDGTSTVGKTINGQNNGERDNFELAFSKSNKHSGNWCKPTQNDKLNIVTINQKVWPQSCSC